ncbi:hypothetical protein C7K25_10640 [Gulosibacter molinativorax]|uniref:DUF3017 domain-containing protein n=2 Tax=Gulosibacter molinativorax TaxID=256821 RepID=A0ABT7CAM5_9MICO|nr:hypothetical protein [Gulosibacter molinativorax]QUY60811.1 Hypotetical protein [Gulosibacter molinativorax]
MPWPAKFALVLGLAALVCSFIPVVGDYVTIPLGVIAIILGCLDIWRAERGRRARVVPATFGTIFGGLALLLVMISMMATQDVPV